jgi:hypothetical protein
MGIALTTKGRLAIKEQASSWGTAETSFAAADYLEVTGPLVPSMPRETLSVNIYTPGFSEAEVIAGSKAGGTFSFSMPMHGVLATTPVANPTIHPDALLFRAALGGGGSDGYSTTVTGGTAAIPTDSSIPVAHAGFATLYPVASGYSIGWNSVVSANTSSDLLVDLSASPAAGTGLGSYVAWLSTAASTPLTVEWLGTDATSKIRYSDCLPSKLTAKWKAKQAPTLDVELTFLSWTNVGSGGDPADYAYGYPRLPAFVGANGVRALFAGGAAICPTEVTIEITQTLEQAECASATEGADSLVTINRSVRVTVMVNPTDYNATPWTDTVATVKAALQIDACTTPGRACSMVLPLPKVMQQGAPTANGSLLGLTSVYGPTIYSADTGTTAPADTEFRIAFL